LAALQKAGLMDAFKNNFRPGAEKMRIVDNDAAIFYDEHSEDREETFAAHLMPPFAGEGVNMAMLDALELSKHLTSEDFIDIRSAINHYEH
jgi:hypothetical protein